MALGESPQRDEESLLLGGLEAMFCDALTNCMRR